MIITRRCAIRRKPFLWIVSVLLFLPSSFAFQSTFKNVAPSIFHKIHFSRPSSNGISRSIGRNRPLPIISAASQLTILQKGFQSFWEGDDRRRTTKLRRQIVRFFHLRKDQPIRTSLLLLNIGIYMVQVISSIQWIRHQYPGVWPHQAPAIIWDTFVTGNCRPGPFTLDFVHSTTWSPLQPHRYITAGFMHGNLLHLLLNVQALQSLPAWLETGLGIEIFLTTYLAAIVGGNWCNTMLLSTFEDASTFNTQLQLGLGASGGICGLYGLLYVCWVRMGNPRAASRVLRGMLWLLLAGAFTTTVSNSSHVGGFVAGCVIALLSGPRYRSSYALKRKNSLQVDTYQRDYRTQMGYDKVPDQGWIPLPVLWIVVLIYLSLEIRFRSMPLLMWRGICHPGSLSNNLFQRPT